MKKLISSLNTKQHNSGFTLIELVIVIVILGILAAIAIPKYLDLQTSATDAAKLSMSGAVKSAFAVCIAENKTEPTVTQLNGCMSSGTTAVATGIQVTINGTTHTVPTYTNTTCATATVAVGNIVRCVGNIA